MAFPQELLEKLPLLIRSNGIEGKTRASDLREFLTELINEFASRTELFQGTGGGGPAVGYSGDTVDQITAEVGADYFYYVLQEKCHLLSSTGVRNVAGFEYQLVQGATVYPIKGTIDAINADVTELTSEQIAGGYTLGVRILRTDTTKASFAVLKTFLPS